MKDLLKSRKGDGNEGRLNGQSLPRDATAIDSESVRMMAAQPASNAAEKDVRNFVSDAEAQSSINAGIARPADDVPPNGGYGWICVISCAFINAHTWGINSSYGVFLSYYLANDVFPGATSFDYALIGGLSVAAAMLVSPAATYSTGLWGTRTTLLIGVAFETVSLITASFSGTTWQLFLSQGACFGFGMGFLFVGSVGVVPQWFTTKRSLANGFAVGGSGIGGLVYSLATGAMIPRIGLPWTFRVLGLITFAVNTTCSLLMKDRNKIIGVKQVPFDLKLFRRWEYILMEAWAFFSILGYILLLFSLPSYVVAVGLNQQQAAVIGALHSLGQGLGRPVVGMFSDVGGRINLAAILTAISGLFCLVIWIFAKSYGVLIFFALIGGTVAGTIWTTVGPVAAEVVGLKDLPASLSMTWLVMMLPAMFSEAIGLEIVSATRVSPSSSTADNPYLYAQIYTGLMYLIAAGCVWLLRAWKIGQMELIAAEKGLDEESVDPVSVPVVEDVGDVGGLKGQRRARGAKSGLMRRLFVVKRV